MLRHSSNPLAKEQLLMQLHVTLGDFCLLCCSPCICKSGGVVLQCLILLLAFLRNITLVRKLPLALHFKEPSLQSHTIFWYYSSMWNRTGLCGTSASQYAGPFQMLVQLLLAFVPSFRNTDKLRASPSM